MADEVTPAGPVGATVEQELGLSEQLRKLWPEGVTQCKWCGGFSRPPCGCPADEKIKRLRILLARCRPIIEADAQMMADISRHAPLDATSQAAHDATEYESERLARELECLLGPNDQLGLVERLRGWSDGPGTDLLVNEAADEIDRLRSLLWHWRWMGHSRKREEDTDNALGTWGPNARLTGPKRPAQE